MKKRCFGDHDPLYATYHDHEWGRPAHEDQYLFEMLVLEGTQAGLNWEIILKRREGYRALFHRFDPTLVAQMSDAELEEVLLNPRIIRNRRKVFAARNNAQVFLEIQREFGSFDTYMRRFVKGAPRINRWKSKEEVPCATDESVTFSKDLRKRGMTFVGPKIIYAFMQAVGLVNDHLTNCPCAS